MQVERDFEQLLKLFNKNKVKYCVIGAFAVAFYAKPRYTKDLDILISSDLENAHKVVKALNQFGFASLNLEEKDFAEKGKIIQLGYEPVRVDILTSLQGLNFKDIWRKKTMGFYGKQKVCFIGVNDLIKSKKLSKRKQDQIDIESLLPIARKKRYK